MTTNQQTLPNVPAADLEEIRQAAMDYMEGWYTGDAARIERAIHPELAKRIILHDPRGFDRLEPISALALVIAARRGAGSRTPPDQQRKDITILDVTGSAAAVRLDLAEYVEYLHLGKLNGQWQIINVLWQRVTG